MYKTIDLSEIGTKITEFSNSTGEEPIAIVENGKPVMVALSYELYTSLLETLEILSDAEFSTQLKAGIQEDREGKRVSWEEAKKQLGWE
ncbi:MULTISPECIES: type II toxin-antitoxin system prevent-host-death family antitoxin [Spirulina sp. CCY15215]|uniref:type II toxin-antitoxin system Phd/YefM family antitoxin n=1 Tax=Spirulina sp. CCY15215 TaxID=2767591 RepID=UPI00194FF959|nr:type II toxin-antitoxin system prevent-host-death family antitoxin [Spirulina major]